VWLSFLFLFYVFSLEKYKLIIFVADISILILIFFIFDFCFCFWPFCRSFIYFQFRYSILIFHILFLQYGLYFFYLLLNYYFFFGKITLSILSSTPFYTLPRCFEKYRNHVNFISVHNILYNIKKINKKYWIIYRFVIVFNWMI
jgi:hypothetical protein